VTTVPVGSVSYCGVTFTPLLIRGTTVGGLPSEIVRTDIRRLAIHAVISRSHAISKMAGAIALLVIACGVGLNAIEAIHLPGVALLNRGAQAGIIIVLVGPALRLFSTAWDPRHVLAVTRRGEGVTLVLRPAPEPFKLVETLEDVQKRWGYAIDLYPDQSTVGEGHCPGPSDHAITREAVSAEDPDMRGRIMDFLLGRWPQILDYIPPDAAADHRLLPTGSARGLCTHPDAIDWWWVHSRGGKRFALASVIPASFFWVGTLDRGGSEYLFLMWFREGRRFWFYDQHVVFVAESEASAERTAARMDSALQRWNANAGDVIYSGIWGLFDVHTSRFEQDDDRTDREDWERTHS
jgi:hypothetical protein